MRLFRIEHTGTRTGMWTHRDVGNRLVLEHLSDSRLLEMPMPDDPVFRKDGEEWKTAVSNMDDMSYWFTVQDVKEMARHGFAMLEFRCDDVQVEEHQVLYMARRRTAPVDITSAWIREMQRA